MNRQELLAALREGRVTPAESLEGLRRLRAAAALPLARPLPDDLIACSTEWIPLVDAVLGNAPSNVARLACGLSPEVLSRLLPELEGSECVIAKTVSISVEQHFVNSATGLLARVRSLLRERLAQPSLLQVLVPAGELAIASGLAALFKTARLENPQFLGQVLSVSDDACSEQLAEAARASSVPHLRLSAGAMSMPHWREIGRPALLQLPWKATGTYLITGGLGGLGLIFAREIARCTSAATLVLTGRSQLDSARQEQVEELRRLGAAVEYRAIDVEDGAAVTQLIQQILQRHGGLNGVLHSAGINRDNFILRKTDAEFVSVLGPKVGGLANIDAATRDVDLDFLALFASLSGTMGNVGQADYAAANAFMDGFSAERNLAVFAGQRQGRTVAIDWPLWAEGGMRPDPATEAMLRDRVGMAALQSEAGIGAFYLALSCDRDQILVMQGDAERLRGLFAIAPALTASAAVPRPAPAMSTDTPKADTPKAMAIRPVAVRGSENPGSDEQLGQRVLVLLKSLFCKVTALPAARVDVREPLETYGIDSIVITQLNVALAEVFNELPKTLFFERRELASAAAYLCEAHRDECIEWTGQGLVGGATPSTIAQKAHTSTASSALHHRRRSHVAAESTSTAGAGTHIPIAIIGLSGRYPQAPNLEAFWHNLRSGVDSIVEIPAERWAADVLYLPDRDTAVAQGKYYAKWGGFLEGFAEFDPLFFGISPREASNMDPQERLFLESCWSTLEDAGYTREQLAEKHAGRVGVFAGVTKTGFGLHGPQLWANGEAAFPHTSFGSIANRVSYLLNLAGPSMPIDTMCSSSLTAIHEACEHLHRGECALALAGGVNLYLHASNYVGLASQRMLSSDGRCRSFGAGGDGFAPGEGVGTVLLKPLPDAERDCDVIHAVILATTINHGGKTNGYTVPNPMAQAELIRSALDRAGIDARRVGYIEAHGTGTTLGDPIEVAGLTRAFASDTADRQYCALGSVKSNIGHLEAAAGIAGVTKLVLQLQHGEWAPSLHAAELNPNIDFTKTPFMVQRERAPWARQVRDGRELPRIGGISSFGAGGANAHALIAEYRRAKLDQPFPVGPRLFVLSAKTEERLQAYVHLWLAYLDDEKRETADLAAIAYTLQVGREPMDERLGLLAETLAELTHKLRAFSQGRSEEHEGLYRGQVKRNKDALAAFEADEDLQAAIASWVQKGKYGKLLDLWVKGLTVDWLALYGDTPPRRISLPTYPFAREYFWLPRSPALPPSWSRTAQLHPLLHTNTSDLREQRFTSEFTGNESFLADHVIGGRPVLPGAAYLEMVRAAVALALGVAEGEAVVLSAVVWPRPYVFGDSSAALHVALVPTESDEIAFDVYSGEPDGETSLHCQGRARVQPRSAADPVDLAALRAVCTRGELGSDECYGIYAAIGMNYGASHRGIDSLQLGEGQVLARLVLPPAADATLEYVLQPGMLDAALQSAIGLSASFENVPATPPMVPFVLDSIEIISPIPSTAYGWVRETVGSGERVRKLDIDLCDIDGRCCVAIRGLASRSLVAPAADIASIDQSRTPIAQVAPPSTDGGPATAAIADLLRTLLSGVLQLAPERIDVDAPLETYGIDSVMVTALTVELERSFGPLSKTLFFEYQTLAELIAYFERAHADVLQRLLGGTSTHKASAVASAESVATAASGTQRRQPRSAEHARYAPRATNAASSDAEGMRIAIIGVAGRYPMAEDLDAFWNNIAGGRDCIIEIPQERWDHRPYSDAAGDLQGKGYCRWGGFLDGVQEFDPQFFNISAREAMVLDPQERLFLQCAYATLENAGYTRAGLRASVGGNVGVYVGVMYEEYPFYGVQAQLAGQPVALSGSPASSANRVSYFCDFHGPSMAVDSMCSSSLTTIHLACQSLARNECALALAGGVNVSIHPNKYMALLQGQFSSSTGRCESFGRGGDGYVPGEGVGAVLLKPLVAAEADGDHIHGVIRATAINHGGKTNGYTVPNPVAQAAVIASAVAASGLPHGSIGYIEAHGTGTTLGDPIEITGLTRAFGNALAPQSCWIGSVKSNIGHAESAAGIAGVTKVLLQMRHGLVAPSLHSQQLNPNIDFAASAFKVPQQLTEWPRPRLNGVERPRAAGVSSFGAGGANAHVIIEEHISTASVSATEAGPWLFLLSARTSEQLLGCVQRMIQFLDRSADALPSPADIAYTLQVGREAMPERLAVLAVDLAALKERLVAFVNGNIDDFSDVHRGALERRRSTAVLGSDDEFRETLSRWLERGKLVQLAGVWVDGLDIDWLRLQHDATPRRVALPTYPFARHRCWVDVPSIAVPATGASAQLHPLLHANVSTARGIRFRSSFDGSEPFLADHRIGDLHVVPGAVYLEMARAAAEHALETGAAAIVLERVVFIQPLALTSATVTVDIELQPERGGAQRFQVFSLGADAARTLHCEGRVGTLLQQPPGIRDLAAVESTCPRHPITPEAFYAIYDAGGMHYGPAHRPVQMLRTGEGQMLAELRLPEGVGEQPQIQVLHPSLVDGALQATLGLSLDADPGAQQQPRLPFAIDRVEIFAPLTRELRVLISRSQAHTESESLQRLDIDLCAPDGSVRARLLGFSSRSPAAKAESGAKTRSSVIMLAPEWRLASIAALPTESVARVVILCGFSEPLRVHLASELGVERCMLLASGAGGPDAFAAQAAETLPILQDLIGGRRAESLVIQIAVAGVGGGGFAGMLKSLRQESPNLIGQVVSLPGDWAPDEIAGALRVDADRAGEEIEIRHAADGRYVRGWRDLPEAAPVVAWKTGGVYLLTGGAGGLGIRFAEQIAGAVRDVTLVLSGRSSLDATRQAQVDALRHLGALVEYREVDIADPDAVEKLIDHVLSTYGRLDGVLHSAGVTRDGFLLKKTVADVQSVMAPKVAGVLNLDRYTANVELDFLILFSSIAGALGNVGQADYAAANAFMDEFAGLRNARVAAGERHGRTLSIGWPLWAEGGMKVADAVQERAQRRSGLTALTTEAGLAAFDRAVATDASHVLVLSGAVQPLRDLLVGAPPPMPPIGAVRSGGTPQRIEFTPGQQITSKALRAQLRESVAATLMLPLSDVDEDKPFDVLGLDSILSVEWIREINGTYGVSISVTDIYDHTTVRAMSGYLRKQLDAANAPKEIGHTANGLLLAGAGEVDSILDRVQRGELEIDEAERLIAKMTLQE